MKSPKFETPEKWNFPVPTGVGHFSVVPSAWESCRERFQAHMSNKEVNSIYYCIDPMLDDAHAIAAFIFKTESILNIKRKSTYQEFYTREGICLRNVMKINIAKFWKTEFLRSNLFTLLVRVASGRVSAGGIVATPYDDVADNYEECINKNGTLSKSKIPFYRFFFFHTHYTGEIQNPNSGVWGWYNIFNTNNNDFNTLQYPSEKYKNKVALNKFWG